MFARAAIRVAARAAPAVAVRAASTTSSARTAQAAAGFGGVAIASLVAAAATTAVATAEPVPHTGVPGTVHERSFIAIKPDGVQRMLIAEVIGRFEKKGYKLVAMKMIWPSAELAAKHYDDLKERKFFPGLVKYFSSGPIIAMVWEGPNVILTGRQILGATNPNAAVPGTLRGDNCVTVGRNMIHGSDGPDSAKHEIGMWFTPEECSDWPRTLDMWISADN